MRRLLLPTLLTAACAPKSATSTPTPPPKGDPPARVDLPAHYAALFEAGRSWTYQVETSHATPDQPPDVETARVRCAVAEIGSFDGGAWSRIECDADFGQQQPVAGVWVADPRGLFQLDEVPGNANELDPEYMKIAAVPAEASEPIIDDLGDGPRRIGERSVTRQGDAWCRSVTSDAPDAAWDEQCFGPSGIASGDVGWSGGSDHETKYILMR